MPGMGLVHRPDQDPPPHVRSSTCGTHLGPSRKRPTTLAFGCHSENKLWHKASSQGDTRALALLLSPGCLAAKQARSVCGAGAPAALWFLPAAAAKHTGKSWLLGTCCQNKPQYQASSHNAAAAALWLLPRRLAATARRSPIATRVGAKSAGRMTQLHRMDLVHRLHVWHPWSRPYSQSVLESGLDFRVLSSQP